VARPLHQGLDYRCSPIRDREVGVCDFGSGEATAARRGLWTEEYRRKELLMVRRSNTKPTFFALTFPLPFSFAPLCVRPTRLVHAGPRGFSIHASSLSLVAPPLGLSIFPAAFFQPGRIEP